MSQPSWAAWIEIDAASNSYGVRPASQPSWAAWIEITSTSAGATDAAGRSPLGLRGLKLNIDNQKEIESLVAALLGCVD